MRHYFMKKYIVTAVFLLLLFLFSTANVKEVLPQLQERIQKYGDVKNAADVKKLITKIDETITENILGKILLIETYGYIQKLLGKNEIDNFRFVRDKNGYLNYPGFYEERNEDYRRYAKRVRLLKDKVEEKGGNVLFISPPSKYMTEFTEMETGLPANNGNLRQDEFLLALYENGVETLDLRQPLQKSNLPYDKLFYKTDHHWTVEAAFEAYCTIVEDMETRYGVVLDPTGYYRDPKNYTWTEYPQKMLGSMGRNTGAVYSGMDNFTYISPKFKTDFNYTYIEPNGNYKKEQGDFEKALIKTGVLESRNIYGQSPYGAYLNEVNPYDLIKNNGYKPAGDLKALFIRDSFFSPVISFLAPLFGEIHAIWPLADNGKVDIEKFLDDNEFDYVFIELYPSNIDDAGFPYYRD